MSRILRRPMFRGGGSVDSYGTGIAAPLVPGYRMGGNVRGGIVDLPGGYNLTANERALFSASDMAAMSNSGVTKGMDLLKRNQAITSGAVPFTSKNIPGVVEEDKTVTTTDDGKSEEVQTSADIANDFDNLFGEKDTITTDSEGNQTYDIAEPSPLVKLNLGLITKKEFAEETRKNELEEIQKKLDAEDGSVAGGGADMSKKSIEVQEPSAGNEPNLEDTEASLAIDPKDAIAANQKLFAELLGADKARGQDIGDMLLRFSGSQGNTVGEKFQNYTRAESAAGPSRSEKIKQTAAGLAINDYVAGKRSAEQIDKLMRVEDYRAKLKTDQFKVNPSKDSWRESLDKTVLKYGGKEGKSDSVGIIAETLKFFEPGQKVFREDNVNPKNLDIGDLEIGITIVTLKNGSKRIIKKTGEGENDFVDLTSKYPV